ncbi:UDP-N-acetylmuramoyl-tripeptide--D-alanyl-D-alanine ligase [uncultured Kriegella sp.]|uniref:UDP-N-acetylmuramoyl-tripeptide--D-alanyl-D- alanine ligase n=1 Tax=uncultured Kriegella sp. TaxID=1798910 RepID=UPI0030D725D3|tara:strand:+ start:236434 stop:237711 length:1278 start_codon:yes stop_codon:yes gene_type:complete
MTIPELHSLFLKSPHISTDTRTIGANCIFFALKGDNFNGNKYGAQALDKGAAYVVLDEKEYATSNRFIVVEDVLQTLQELASYHRNYCDAKIIALTGSNGKTTTKELINVVLSKKYNTTATKGNLNNHIGVPLTLLTLTKDTQIAIIEMGANHLKEIAFLCNIAQPDFGYITNFGKAHLEGFGSREGVIKAKSELYDYLIRNDKSIFMNADDSVQMDKLSGYVKKYGFSTENQTFHKIEFLGADPFVKLKTEGSIITSQLVGRYNFTNSAAAVLIGKYFNVPLSDIKSAIGSYTPENNRSQIIEKNGHKIILDAYNANPTSMEAALKNFDTMGYNPKIAFLGDMFELGASAAQEHQYIADLVAKMNIDKVFFIGKNFFEVKTAHQKFDSFDSLSSYFESESLPQESHILIKGSRGMALERLLNLI